MKICKNCSAPWIEGKTRCVCGCEEYINSESKIKQLGKIPYKVVAVIAAVAVVCIIVSYAVGYNVNLNSAAISKAAQTKLKTDDEYTEKTELLKSTKSELSDVNGDLTSAKSELSDLEAKISDKQASYEAAVNYEENKETLDAEISTKQTELDSLNSEISVKQAELDRLTTGISVAEESPVTLPAGYFTVGTDINPGRYSVTGSSNFIVHTSSGSLKVNTILGGRNGVDQYVCYLESGDVIKASSRCTYTPVE